MSAKSFSTVECSLVQLASDIDNVYKELRESEPQFCISRLRLAGIKYQILSYLYILSPLRVKFIDKGSISSFIDENLPDCPDIMIGASHSSKKLRVMMPNNKEDALVLTSLSVMLHRLSHGSLPKDSYRLEDRVDSLYENLQQMVSVDRLIKLDLMVSSRTIQISVVEEKIRYVVGDDSVFQLISSFLNLPIMDEKGNNRKGLMHFSGIPEVGEITYVLLDIILMETFDRYFPKGFPGIAFYRFINEVYISINDKDIFDEKDVSKLLIDLGLLGNMESIRPGDEPLLCYYHKLLYLDSDRKVYLCDPKDYSSNLSSIFL